MNFGYESTMKKIHGYITEAYTSIIIFHTKKLRPTMFAPPTVSLRELLEILSDNQFGAKLAPREFSRCIWLLLAHVPCLASLLIPAEKSFFCRRPCQSVSEPDRHSNAKSLCVTRRSHGRRKGNLDRDWHGGDRVTNWPL